MFLNLIQARNQIQFNTLDDFIEPDSDVFVIDAFCNFIDPSELGFVSRGTSYIGRPAFDDRTLIAIYIYGYLNGIRSSRKLDKACNVNVELWWLTNKLNPGYKTIANFRKDNQTGFRNLFNSFRDFCLKLGLYGKETVAIDGSKFRAQNSKKNNYNANKILQHLDYIENQEKDFIAQLEFNDNLDNQQQILDKLDNIHKRKQKYNDLKEQLNNSGHTQISTTDHDAKALPLHMNIVEVAYNVQTSVDDKHNLVVEFEATNQKDEQALEPMASKTKDAFDLGNDDHFTALADKGYHTAEQLDKCHNLNIDTLVAPKDVSNKNIHPDFQLDKFIYDIANDLYICPAGNELSTNGNWINHKAQAGRKPRRTKRYRSLYSVCSQCPFFNDCVKESSRRNKHGRYIDRNEFQNAVDKNNNNVHARKVEYKRRQAIVEHPFGTIKRGWGYTYTLMKGLKKVNTEFSIIFTCYNIKRAMNIIGKNELIKALKSVFCHFFATLLLIMAHISNYFYNLHNFLSKTVATLRNYA
ncbi:MAG: IS1182 family transposase [Saprospiraceae bacterium]